MINPKKTLKNIIPYEIDRYYQEYDLKLDSNENLFGPSPNVISALRSFNPDKVNYYPAYGNLVDRLSDILGCGQENIIFTNGCDEAINVLFNTFLDKDDKVLSFAPTFSMPKLYSDIIGAEFFEISYNSNWEFDLELFEKNIDSKTKILYITSPNNPTGGVVDLKTIEYLLNKYKDKLLALDFTYFNFSELSHQEFFDLVKKYDNVAILKSFSKDFALAGLRLGFIYANKNIINEVKKVISPYSVNAAAVIAGIEALNDIHYFREIMHEIKKSKAYLIEELNKLGFRAYSTQANFVLCDFGDYADFYYQKLLNNGIKVKYFKNVKGLDNTFRITVPPTEGAKKFIDVLKVKPMFVFDLDGVVFDVKNSYREAIKKTFARFTGYECSDEDMQDAKNMGGLANDWDLTHYLIKKAGFSADYNDLIRVFQNYFFVPDKEGSKGLIDREEVVFNSSFFEKLTKYADCAVFTGRPRIEAFYSLEKFNIKKYFSYFMCNEDLEGNQKPSPFGLGQIKKHCRFSDIYYFGDTVDDIKAGNDANVTVFGIIPPNAAIPDKTVEIMKNLGAKDVFLNPDELLNKLVKEKINANY